MNILRSLLVLGALCGPVGLASAATVSPDISGQPGVLTQDLPPLGTGLSPDSVTVFSGTDAEGTLSADLGLFNLGGSLSTNASHDPFRLAFLKPIKALQFSVGITDLFGAFLSGIASLQVDAEVFDFNLAGVDREPIAVVSDTGFQSASLSILDFDTNASSIAFLDAQTLYAAGPTPIPLPAGGALLIAGLFVLLGWKRRPSLG